MYKQKMQILNVLSVMLRFAPVNDTTRVLLVIVDVLSGNSIKKEVGEFVIEKINKAVN
ncbi:MAG: hypothetical protein KJ769_08420 [Candidatus Margulisbacteria bacterium]|nr:hypothetical protein [Candidatus Margulisiibacteriota bacterium]